MIFVCIHCILTPLDTTENPFRTPLMKILSFIKLLFLILTGWPSKVAGLGRKCVWTSCLRQFPGKDLPRNERGQQFQIVEKRRAREYLLEFASFLLIMTPYLRIQSRHYYVHTHLYILV